MRRVNSIGYLNEEEIAKKKEMDEHVASYVSDQLERLRSNESTSVAEDEMSAQMDGTNEFEVQSDTPPDQQEHGDDGHRR